MAYVVEALVAVVTIGWVAREFARMQRYRACCTARLRKAGA
ncbi:hypothetical protein [Aestuariivirga litoralis]|nr:hypothetical protein [Aestuariivirga litoralis]